MTDEEKEQKYKNIVHRLKVINRKIEELKNDISNLENTTQKSIIINEEVYNADKINSAKSSLSSASKTIKGNIIPSLNRKIYD